MKRNYNLKVMVLFLTLAVSLQVNAHDWRVHQHITREAFALLEKSFPGQLQEMASYVGTNETTSTGYWWSSPASWGGIKNCFRCMD